MAFAKKYQQPQDLQEVYPMNDAENYRENDGYYFAEVGCHKCDALLGGIGGEKPKEFMRELRSVLKEKLLCKRCTQ